MLNRSFWLVLLLPATLPAQPGATPPPFSLNARDVFAEFQLPPLKDSPDGPLYVAASNLQVAKRAAALAVNGISSTDAWTKAQTTVPALQNLSWPLLNTPFPFQGTKASELNRVLIDPTVQSVRVHTAQLLIDEPIRMQRSGVALDLRGTKLVAANPDPYLLRVENVSYVSIEGGDFLSGSNGILIGACDRVRVRGTTMRALTGDGIVVTGSSNIWIYRNHLSNLSGTPILVGRATTQSLIEGNEITGNKGYSNMTAGIVLSDREVDLAADPRLIFGPDGYWVVGQAITSRTHPPHDNIVLLNHVAENLSSGVYLDGALRNVVASNTIERNAKEGLCLDNEIHCERSHRQFHSPEWPAVGSDGCDPCAGFGACGGSPARRHGR